MTRSWPIDAPLAFAVIVGVGACRSEPHRPPAPPPGTRIERVEGRVRIASEYARRSESGSAARERLQLTETAGATLHGSVYDPRFLTFAIGGALGLSHESPLHPPGVRTHPLTDYEALLELLPKHPYSATAFAHRRESRDVVWSGDGTPVLESLVQDFGGRLSYRQSPLWVEAGVRDAIWENETLDATRREDRNTYDFRLRHRLSDWATTMLSWQRDVVHERETEESDYTTDDVYLENVAGVGGTESRRRLEFSSGLSLNRRSGDSGSDFDRAWEEIRFRPGEDLDSTTRYERSESGGGVSLRRSEVRQQLVHRLYESLTTTLTAGVSDEDYDAGGSDQWAAEGQVDYRKRTFLGPLSLSAVRGQERRTYDSPQTTLSVRNESHALRDGGLVLLDRPNVIVPTVVVTDVTGAVVYQRGLDYELTPRGTRLEIERVLGSRIADGGAVLVGYDYESPQADSIGTSRRGLFASLYVFETVRLYWRADRTIQSARPRSVERDLDDTDDRTVGAELTLGELRALAELEHHDSTLTPFRAARGSIGYTADLSERATAGVSAHAMRTSFQSEGGDSVRSLSLRGHLAARFGSTGLLRFEPGYRIDRGRDDDSNRLDLLADASWTYGQIRFALEVRYQGESAETDRTAETTVEFTVERRW